MSIQNPTTPTSKPSLSGSSSATEARPEPVADGADAVAPQTNVKSNSVPSSTVSDGAGPTGSLGRVWNALTSGSVFNRPQGSEMPALDIDNVGDGRNAMTRDYLDGYAKQTLQAAFKLWPGGEAAYSSVLERIEATKDRNPAPRTDFQGHEVEIGEALTLKKSDGSAQVLVAAEQVPDGQRIRHFEMSPDGNSVAVGFGGKGDLETWKVIDVATQQERVPAVQFNSFGESRVKFMPDSKAIVYPSLDADVKAARSILYRELPKLGESAPEPEVIFTGESVLPHFPHVIDKNTVLAEASIQIGETQGFPNFTALVKRGEDGQWQTSQETLLPAGYNGRVVDADAKAIVYQTNIDSDNRSLVSVDPRSGERRDLIPPKDKEVLHVVDRVGEFYCALYLTDDPTCTQTDQTWRLRIFDSEGAELRTVEMAELGMPARLDPSLSFSGDRQTKSRTEFTLGSLSHSRQTFSIDLEAMRNQLSAGEDVASLPLDAMIRARAATAFVDFDPSKVGTHFEHVPGPEGTTLPVTYYWAKERPDGRIERFDDLPSHANVQPYAYGSIGITRTPINEPGFRDLMERGVVIAYVGLPGGGYRGSESRDRGAYDRTLTIRAAAAVGHHLGERFPDGVRFFVGRSWGGWLAENIAALSAKTGKKAFDVYLSVVSAGGALRMIGVLLEQWALHDFGARMGKRGEVSDAEREHALAQAKKTDTPSIFRGFVNAAARFFMPHQREALGHLIVAPEKDDGRAEPGSSARSLYWLTRLLGTGPRVNAIVGDGGHGARNHAKHVPLVYNRVLRDMGRTLGEHQPLSFDRTPEDPIRAR